MYSMVSAILLLSLSGSAAAGATDRNPAPVDYVAPNIGGIGQLLTATVPYVQTPHGMARLAPVTTPGINDRYLADKIYGFPAGPAMLMVSTGKISTEAKDYASTFDHDDETTTPYYYAVDLESWGIRAEFTASQTTAYYRFRLPAGSAAHLALTYGGWGRAESCRRLGGGRKRKGRRDRCAHWRRTMGRRGSTSTLNSRSPSTATRHGRRIHCRRARTRPAITSASSPMSRVPAEIRSRFGLDSLTSARSRPKRICSGRLSGKKLRAD